MRCLMRAALGPKIENDEPQNRKNHKEANHKKPHKAKTMWEQKT